MRVKFVCTYCAKEWKGYVYTLKEFQTCIRCNDKQVKIIPEKDNKDIFGYNLSIIQKDLKDVGEK